MITLATAADGILYKSFFIGAGPSHRVLLDRDHCHDAFIESKRGGFVAQEDVRQYEITNQLPVFRLILEQRFQLAGRLAPTFMCGGMITGDFLRPA